MTSKIKLLWLLLIGIFILSACNLPASAEEPSRDPNAVFTAAAQTASVQLTEAAIASNTQKTATPTSSLFLPTVTPAATQVVVILTATVDDKCYKADFISDVTIPDGTEFSAGESFTKTWRVRNIGDCAWTADFALVFDAGEKMGGTSPQLLMGSVAPGDTVDISINLVAPSTIGTYTGNWQIRNTEGKLFAKVYVQIKVVDPNFAVTSVQGIETFYIAGRGAAFAAKVSTNRAGNVKYHWIIRESGQPDITTPVEEVAFAASGTQDIAYLWPGCPHTGNFTASLYIDNPNHQEFGSASFKCP